MAIDFNMWRAISSTLNNLVENLKAKFDGKKSFEDVARSVYDEFDK